MPRYEYSGSGESRILGYLGLAARAGQLLKGNDPVLEGLLKGKVKLVLITRDAGQNVENRISRAADEIDIPIIIALDKGTLGSRLGRASYAVVGVTSGDLARGILKVLSDPVPVAD